MATNTGFVQAVASVASQEFNDRIGTVTKENINKIGDIISSYPTAKNEFINVLTNQVAKTRFFNKVYENPYKIFNKGILPYGKSIEGIFVDIIKGKDRTYSNTTSTLTSDLLERQSANVKAEYYSENMRLQYKATISDEDLKSAFRSENGLATMTDMILTAPLSSAEYDQFITIRHMLGHLNGATETLAVAYTEKDLMKKIKEHVLKMQFLSNKYNGQGVMTFTKPQDLVCFMNAELLAKIDVELLATAFNTSYTKSPIQILPIDKFEKCVTTGSGSTATTTYSEDTDTLCVICDKEAIQIWDTLNSSESFRNPQGLYTNVFFNRWSIATACNFANVLKIKKAVASS